MDAKQRASLIREGNAAFNSGDIRKAREVFLATGYQDGLLRLGDHFMYEKKLPMLAYGYYKKAGRQDKVEEIFQRMIFALSEWLGKDKMKVQPPKEAKPVSPEDFQVHPILKAKALEILGKKS